MLPLEYGSDGVTTADQAVPALVAAYAKLRAFLAANGLKEAEPPLAITREFNDETKQWRFEAALLPEQGSVPIPPSGEVQVHEPSGKLSICHPSWVFKRWCLRQRAPILSGDVAPPFSQLCA